MGTDNVVFLEVIEWFDPTGQELVHRIPEKGSGEIKWGAQLTVRESQAGVFFHNGKAVDAFGAGRHTLKTGNLPILTKILSVPWGMTSPLRAEVYFVNLKTFANLKWGTRDPVAFRDKELGLVRLRAHGVFNLQVVQPLLFINRLVGTMGYFTTADIEDYLRRVIVSRFNDYLGEKLSSLMDLPGRYDDIARGLEDRLREDFSHLGLGLARLYVTSITPPPDVQQAIDDRGRIAAVGNLDDLVRMKAAMAMEKAAAQEGAGAMGAMGVGLALPALFATALVPGGPGGGGDAGPGGAPAGGAGGARSGGAACGECGAAAAADARFCAACGHQIVVFDQCSACHKNLPPSAKFCPRCGALASVKPSPRACGKCGEKNEPGSVFCNQCGEKL